MTNRSSYKPIGSVPYLHSGSGVADWLNVSLKSGSPYDSDQQLSACLRQHRLRLLTRLRSGHTASGVQTTGRKICYATNCNSVPKAGSAESVCSVTTTEPCTSKTTESVATAYGDGYSPEDCCWKSIFFGWHQLD